MTGTGKAEVLIIMGSQSDHEVMKSARELLGRFSVSCEYCAASAHRAPERVIELAGTAKDRGIKVIIAGAGLAAHLPGMIAAHSPLPVIGVPLPSGGLNGLDSLLSIVQMPPGVPVAAMAIGAAGAKNAALLAVQILALQDEALAGKLDEFRREQSRQSVRMDFD